VSENARDRLTTEIDAGKCGHSLRTEESIESSSGLQARSFTRVREKYATSTGCGKTALETNRSHLIPSTIGAVIGADLRVAAAAFPARIEKIASRPEEALKDWHDFMGNLALIKRGTK